MIKTELTTEIAAIEEMLGELKNKAPNVLVRAINRTVTNVKKNMSIETTRNYYIKSNDVKKTIRISKATRNKLLGVVSSRAGMVPLIKFKITPNRTVSYKNGKPNPKQYRASVKKENGTKALDKSPKAFIAVMKSGHVGVFERKSGNSFPIKQLYGPSIPQMIGNQQVINKIEKEANSTLQKRIEAEIEYLLRG